MAFFFDFIQAVFLASAAQMAVFPGMLIFFGLILYLLARFTHITYSKSGSHRFHVYFSGWIGTPVHELGHALFCILFGHKINEINLFNPTAQDGQLGHVKHSYNQTNLYHQTGNFFIGAGPVIAGSVLIFLMIYLLVPSLWFEIPSSAGISVLSDPENLSALFMTPLRSLPGMIRELLLTGLLLDYRFWIFFYVSASIASHMELSPADLAGAAKGLLFLFAAFLIINGVFAGLEQLNLNIPMAAVHSALGGLMEISAYILGYAVLISGVYFLLVYLVFSLVNLVRGRGLINPLW
jgi:hypothetical protein